MNEYVNLEQVRKSLDLASENVADDTHLRGLIFQASRAIDNFTRRRFYPTSETRFYDHKDSKLVRLDEDLLSLTELKTQNGACTIASGAMFVKAGDNYNVQPYDRIELDQSTGSVLRWSGTLQKANEVTGVWGYHEDWDNAWIDLTTSMASAMGTGSQLLYLAGAGSVGAGASDANYVAPRLGIGDLVKVEDGDGSYEWMNVMAACTTNAAVVKRGMNGTSATSHSSAASLSRFDPEPEIRWSTQRLVTWIRGQEMTPFQERVLNTFTGDIRIPQTWPPEVKAKLETFKRRRIKPLD
jgi:hypothetical protein